MPLKHSAMHIRICHHWLVVAHCAFPGALPDYLEEQGDLVDGTDYLALLVSIIELFCKHGVHKTWQWFADKDAMCLTPTNPGWLLIAVDFSAACSTSFTPAAVLALIMRCPKMLESMLVMKCVF